AGHHGELGVLDQAEHGSLALVDRPPTGAGVALSGRRMSGGAYLELAGLGVEGEVYGGREPLLPVLADQVVVGRGQELPRRQCAEQATERPGQLQRAGAGLLALAGHVDDRELDPAAVAWPGGDDEVAGERRTARRPERGLDQPLVPEL